MPESVRIADKFRSFDDVWSPKIVARVDDHDVKLVKMLGEFTWHSHSETDEMFIVLTGHVRIEFRDHHLELDPGDLAVIPRGVEHRPVAGEIAEALLFERRETVNTGDAADSPLTAVDEFLD